MNFQSMQRQVRLGLRDGDGRAVEDEWVEDWLNEAALDIAARLELLHGSKTQADEAIGSSDNTITLPTDLLRVLSLRLGTTDDAEMVDDDVWNSWSDSGDEPDHTIFRIFNGLIELYPTPTAGSSYRLRYVRTPATLNTPEDVSELPTHLHPKLVHYARWRALELIGEEGLSAKHLALYEDGLPPRVTGKERNIPGPVSLHYLPGPFDLADSAHI